MVLLPRSCPLSIFWFSKISYIEKMPLKIFTVESLFHKIGVKYIKTKEGLEIPLEYVYGLIFKIINKMMLFTQNFILKIFRNKI
jgi:hypothetical protein